MSGEKPTFGCGICGRSCRPLRRRAPDELAGAYQTYFGKSLPCEIVARYFTVPNVEFHCSACDMRWYGPGSLGDGDFYGTLGHMFDWYYAPDSWDKQAALAHITARKAATVVDVGCGDGAFLACLRARNITAIGLDINRQAVEAGRARGLDVFLPDDSPVRSCDVLCLFQTIEHLDRPIQALQDQIARYAPRELLVSAPTFRSLLGYSSDPLAWPPHHRSAWSRRGFESLARKLGLRLRAVWYEGLTIESYRDISGREPQGRIAGLPAPDGRLGRMAFHCARHLGRDWASRRHSILVSLGRP